MKSPKEFFKEELSGEPLTEESVIEGLELFAKQLLEEYTNRIVENVSTKHEEGSILNPEGDWVIDKESITNQLPLMLKEIGI